jgi:RNA polymerase sigma factor (sigma-70 family)
VSDAQAADRQRLTGLFRQHGDAIFAYASDRVGREDAQDLVGEVFTVAWRRLPSIRVGQERPWLFGVARRLIIQYWRNCGENVALHARLNLQAQPEGEGEQGPSAAVRADVMAALSALPEIDREVLLLRYWYDFSGGEAAKVLGCSAPTYAVRLHRAHRRFESAYRSKGGNESPMSVGEFSFAREVK